MNDKYTNYVLAVMVKGFIQPVSLPRSPLFFIMAASSRYRGGHIYTKLKSVILSDIRIPWNVS